MGAEKCTNVVGGPNDRDVLNYRGQKFEVGQIVPKAQFAKAIEGCGRSAPFGDGEITNIFEKDGNYYAVVSFNTRHDDIKVMTPPVTVSIRALMDAKY